MHKDLFEPVPNDNHQAIVVATYIKDRIGRHIVGRIEHFFDMVEVLELSMLNRSVPLAQHPLCFRMFLPEITKHFDGDDVHGRIISN